MGLFNRLLGMGDDPPWGIVVRDATNGAFAEPPGEIETDELRWPEPISKDEFRRVVQEEYGERLDETHYYKLVQLAPDDDAAKWNMDEVAWVIEPDEDETELAKKIDKVESKMDQVGDDAGAAPDVNLTDVDSEQELQAKMKGAILQKGIDDHADSIEDLTMLLESVKDDPPDSDDPMSRLLDNVDTDMRVNSLSDAALFMTLMEGQDQIGGILGKLNGALDSGSAIASLMAQGGGASGGGGGASNPDEVTISRDEYRELVAGGDSASGDSGNGSSGGTDDFSMDDYAEDDDGDVGDQSTDAGDESANEAPTDRDADPTEQIDERYYADDETPEDMTTDDATPMSASPASQPDSDATEEV